MKANTGKEKQPSFIINDPELGSYDLNSKADCKALDEAIDRHNRLHGNQKWSGLTLKDLKDIEK